MVVDVRGADDSGTTSLQMRVLHAHVHAHVKPVNKIEDESFAISGQAEFTFGQEFYIWSILDRM